jgi:hypothetical protein
VAERLIEIGFDSRCGDRVVEHLAKRDPRSVSASSVHDEGRRAFAVSRVLVLAKPLREVACVGDAVCDRGEGAGERSANVVRAVVELGDVEDRVVGDRDVCRIADAGQYIGEGLGYALLSDGEALCPRERGRSA